MKGLITSAARGAAALSRSFRQGEEILAIWSREGGIELWESGQVELLSETGAFPAPTRPADGGVLAAWEENGAIALRRLR